MMTSTGEENRDDNTIAPDRMQGYDSYSIYGYFMSIVPDHYWDIMRMLARAEAERNFRSFLRYIGKQYMRKRKHEVSTIVIQYNRRMMYRRSRIRNGKREKVY